MQKPTAPSPRRRASGTTSTLRKKAAPSPTLTTHDEIMAAMRAEASERAPKPKGAREIRNQTVQKQRRLNLEEEEPNPKMVALYRAVRTKRRLAQEIKRLPAAIRKANEAKPLYGHQLITLDLYRRSPFVLDFGDPGTGKTRSASMAAAERRRKGGGKILVLAPRTLLETAWKKDINEFCGDMKVSVGHSFNRPAAFEREADFYVTNIDAIKWLLKNPKVLKGFDTLIIDELTAFKHSGSARTAAMKKLSKLFTYRAGLTGTPNSRSVTEIWSQAYIIDGGKALGPIENNFKYAVQEKDPDDPYRWVDKPNMEEVVAMMLADICVRHRFADCMDIPQQHIYTLTYVPPAPLLLEYQKMEALAGIDKGDKQVRAANAAVLRNKLLQIASGAVYATGDTEGTKKPVMILDTERSELVLDLVCETDYPCLVFFNWGHQKEQLMELADKRNLNYGLLDRTTSDKRRTEIVSHYQAGLLKVLFLHPKTGAHGLTLTAGRRTICVSPFDEADVVKQVFHRTRRGGQKHKTEVIIVQAEDTLEEAVYANRDGKYASMKRFLELCELDENSIEG